jgi:hypothetical protein
MYVWAIYEKLRDGEWCIHHLRATKAGALAWIRQETDRYRVKRMRVSRDAKS